MFTIVLFSQPMLAVLIMFSMMIGFEDDGDFTVRNNEVILTIYASAWVMILFGPIGTMLSFVLFMVGNIMWASR